jgi:hypothetical protein
MTLPIPIQRDGVAQMAGRILIALRRGEGVAFSQALDHARRFTAQPCGAHWTALASTLEMERMEALSGVLESLRDGRKPKPGAMRLLEHLANPPEANERFRRLEMPAAARCSRSAR